MKVFISWSGNYSRAVAKLVAEWLPQVIQEARPWISDENIEKGAPWLEALSDALSSHSFGIVVVSLANREAPWLQFEAGALSKALDARVAPLLCDLQPADLAGNPLSLRQATTIEKGDMLKLVQAINAGCAQPIASGLLERSFEKWWPDLESDFLALTPDGTDQVLEPKQSDELQLLNVLYDEVLFIKRQITSNKTNSAIAQALVNGARYGGLGGVTVPAAPNASPAVLRSIADMYADPKARQFAKWAEQINEHVKEGLKEED